MLRKRTIALIFGLVVACGGGSTLGPASDDAGTGVDAGDADASTGSDGTTPGIDAGVDARTNDATTDAAKKPDAKAPGTSYVRIMSANITSGTQQAYEAPGIRIFQGLQPDIVLIQEFNYKSGTLRSLVDTAFGTDFSFYVETRTGGIPNGIVSRYPILSSGTWVDASVSDRAFAWAQIDIPGPIDLWAVSLHLLTTGETQRDTEAKQLVGYIQANVPSDSYLVVGGDLNTDATTELALMDLAAVVTMPATLPADQLGNIDTSTNRNRPHDWVLVSPELDVRASASIVGTSTYDAGLVFDTRVYTPLTDVPPIQSGDSTVAGMQHMPVIRDFFIPGDADAGTDASTDSGSDDASSDDASD